MGNPSYNCVFGGLRLWRRFMFRPPWPFHTPRACLACGARPRCMCRSAAVMWCVGGCVPPRMVTVPASRTRSSVLSAPLQDAFTPVASARTPPFSSPFPPLFPPPPLPLLLPLGPQAAQNYLQPPARNVSQRLCGILPVPACGALRKRAPGLPCMYNCKFTTEIHVK